MTATISRPTAAIPTTPPANWNREVPRYRVVLPVRPSPNSRHRFEPPFSSFSDSAVWQYADRAYEAGEIIETGAWPNPAFHPLNYSAKMVIEFYRNRVKSRLQSAPWQGGKVVLSDGLGLTGSGPRPHVKTADMPA
ncbi:hypothetical protein AB7G19_17100 [Bradyrhizobium sp. 215_C5_N1_1]|uniref:hypothetical protein n=1 Tax=unclassified Bradyrhizobium TaxID=2631580 RepID=UPI003F88B0DF